MEEPQHETGEDTSPETEDPGALSPKQERALRAVVSH